MISSYKTELKDAWLISVVDVMECTVYCVCTTVPNCWVPCKLLNIEDNTVIHRGPMKIKKNGGNVIIHALLIL